MAIDESRSQIRFLGGFQLTPLEVLAIVALLFWLGLSLDRSRAWPTEMALDLDAPEDWAPGDSPSVVAIVPARNEAEMVPDSIPSLLAQPELARLVLVDDSSEDGTADRARQVAGATERLLVVTASETPAGWAGKVHALACGLEVAPESTWVLFTDADIRHRPGSLRSLLAKAEEGYDMVSIMARLRTVSIWERLLVPTFVFFFQLLYPFRRVADPASSVAAAAGGCVLVRRSVLVDSGAIEAIRSAVIDDVALAKSLAAAGGRLWLGFDAGIESLRPYPRLADLWNMVARSAYDQLGYRAWLLIAVLIGLAVFFVSPAVVALLALGIGSRAALWAVATLALQARALLPAVRHHRLPAGYAWILPLSALFFGLMTISSAWSYLSGSGVSWRGRNFKRSVR